MFHASDPGAGPASPRSNSNVTAFSFDAAASLLGPITLINFESTPLGNFASLGIGAGVTATLVNTDSVSSSSPGINSAFGDAILGFNTTIGGSRYLRVVPIFNIGTASVTFTFGTPIQAYGSYLIGLGTANGTLSAVFNDGSAQSLSVVGNGAGGAKFYGFTDAGKSISSVKLELTNVSESRDIFAIDDLRFVPVPEPSSWLILVAGLPILGAIAQRKLRRITHR